MITNAQAGTNVQEIASDIYRINTPISIPGGPGQFSFNQYLLLDQEPTLFHTGPRRLFPLVQEAVSRLMRVQDLKYIGLSHFEADECGALNEFLAAARKRYPSVVRLLQWSRLVISPTAHPARLQMVRNSQSAVTRCAGLTLRICRMRGSAD